VCHQHRITGLELSRNLLAQDKGLCLSQRFGLLGIEVGLNQKSLRNLRNVRKTCKRCCAKVECTTSSGLFESRWENVCYQARTSYQGRQGYRITLEFKSLMLRGACDEGIQTTGVTKSRYLSCIRHRLSRRERLLKGA